MGSKPPERSVTESPKHEVLGNFLPSDEAAVLTVKGGEFATPDIDNDRTFRYGSDSGEVVAERKTKVEGGDEKQDNDTPDREFE